MKNLALLNITIVIIGFNTWANTDIEYTYSKLFEEGKAWEVVENWYNFETNETTMVRKRIKVNKDWDDGEYRPKQVTIFNMETSESSIESFLEENKIIFRKYYDGYRKIIDFNLGKGDEVPVEEGSMEGEVLYTYYVVNDEIANIKGINRRIISIGREIDGLPSTYWIEGIGAINDFLMLEYQLAPTCAPYLRNRHIASCYVGERCIFSYEDFKDYISSSRITSPINNTVNNCCLSYNGNSIKINGNIWNASIKIYSFDGSLCVSENVEGNNAVSTSSLPAGLYLVCATFPDGAFKSLKFVKK